MTIARRASGKSNRTVRTPAIKFAKLRKRMEKRRVEKWLVRRDRGVK